MYKVWFKIYTADTLEVLSMHLMFQHENRLVAEKYIEEASKAPMPLALHGQVANVEMEMPHLIESAIKRDALVTERDKLKAQLDNVTAERDALVAERAVELLRVVEIKERLNLWRDVDATNKQLSD